MTQTKHIAYAKTERLNEPAMTAVEGVIEKPMTRRELPKVEAKYWHMWQDIFTRWGVHTTRERNDLRHSVIEDVFGEYRKQQTFSRAEWDMMYYAQDMLLEHGQSIWSAEIAQAAREHGLRKTYVYNIEQLAADDYINAIARDVFGSRDWRELAAGQMRKLLYTIKSRFKSAQGRGQTLINSDAADDNNDPF